MDLFRFLMIILTFCSMWEELVAVLCWRNPYCFCTGRKVKNIYCRGVRDISNIKGLFSKETWTNRLRIYGNFTTLPSKGFDNFKVNYLALGAPLEENIPEDALEGMQSLYSVNLTFTRFQKIPRAVVPENIRRFQSIRGLLSIIDTEIQNRTHLEQLRLHHNEISHVSSIAFYGSSNIQTLDLSYNRLTYLDPGTFAPLTFLYYINLKMNQLLSVDGVFQMLNPRIINLYGNNISSVENVFHQGMWSTKILNLGGNPLLNLSASAFNGSMKTLAEFYLSDINFGRVDPHLLIYFPNLVKLYMNRDNITFLPKMFFKYSPSLNTLEMSDNHLESMDGLFNCADIGLSSWKEVLLDGNNLSSISFGECFKGVQTLDISRNRIKSINKKDMESLESLKYLNLSWNGISEMESECFADLHQLEYLHLSGSNMKSLNGSLRNVRKLNTFSMRHSSLESLSEEDFSGSQSIRKIDLKNNSLMSVHRSFRSLKYLNALNVSMNNLTTLTIESFPQFQRLSMRVQSLSMADNPWSCDCRLSWIVNWLQKKGTLLKDNPICSTPAHLQGRNISSLSKGDFERWVDNCPAKCACSCLAQGEDVQTEVNCREEGLEQFPQVLPSNALSVNLQGNVLDSFDGKDVLYLKDLQYLNLEDNKISKIRLELPNGTSSVFLAGNKLQVLSQSDLDILGALSSISLSRNPWTCSCDTWSFRTWLLQYNDSVFDLHEVRCGPDEGYFLRNKLIIELTHQDLCAVLHVSTMIIFAFCASVVFCLCLLCCVWWHSICAWLYSCGCSCLKSDEKYDEPYDVFLMHSEEDQDLALGELAKGLEAERFLVCIPSRDVRAPRTPERVSAYLMQCSKVVVLLTRKFIENDDCMHLLKTAMSYSLDSNARYIIFVSHGDVPPRSRLDPLLAATMKSCRCLLWGERLFWQKMVYYLPKIGHKTMTADRGTEDEEPLLS